MKKVAIIGSGIGAISLSIRLSNLGYDVDVYEKNSYPGGKLTTIKSGKYSFDAGPQLFTMPTYVDELFELSGENPRKFFNYKRKEIGCKYFWEDGIELCAYSDQNKFVKEVNLKLGVDKNILKSYLKKAKKKYELSTKIVLEKSLHKLSTFFSKDVLKAILNFRLFEFFKTLSKVNQQQLKEKHLIQFYNRFATYIGSSPYKTSGIMTVIQHLESHFGTFFPEGGLRMITNVLVELAERKNVNFIYNTVVTEILCEKNNVVGVQINGNTKKKYEIVISNMDIYFTYEKLLKNIKTPYRVKNVNSSSSALIFYWGINDSFQNLELHNIFFSKDYKKEFNSIFNEMEFCDDPTIYLSITSKDNPSDAPVGCENWYVMINTHYDSDHDWEDLAKRYRKIIIKKIERVLGKHIEKNIVSEEILSPKTIFERTQSYRGALYGPSSNETFSAFHRHPNFTNKLNNLYFCGGSVHPGGGIPMCLLSAKIVSTLISQKYNSKVL